MADTSRELRGRPVTADEARTAVTRLINSHFRNANSARCSIPLNAMDDDVVAADYVEEASERIKELEAKLAALDWTEITESNLPKVGDEVMRFRADKIRQTVYAVDGTEEQNTLIICLARGDTHFRPINPPVQP